MFRTLASAPCSNELVLRLQDRLQDILAERLAAAPSVVGRVRRMYAPARSSDRERGVWTR